MIKNLQINIKGQLYTFDQPKVMGILNVTPDSFFDGNQYTNSMLSEGADIIDIGAYSSRPGAADVSAEEEWQRLEKAFEVIAKYYSNLIISVDTFRAEIARKSILEGGAAIINDISGGEIDKAMFATIAQLHVPYILMHMQGIPQNMQNNPNYKNVTIDVVKYLSQRELELHK